MKFNARGDLGAGIGTVVTVNRQPVPMPGPRAGFFQCWRDDDMFLVNASSEPLVSAFPEDKVPFHLYQHRRVTGWQPELFDERGATLAHGGAGNFAAYLAARPAFVSYGVFNGAPFDSQQPAINRYPWILLDGVNDGRLLFATPDGGTLKYLEVDGTVRAFPIGPHVEGVNIRLADGGIVYYDEARPRSLILQHADGPVETFACVDTPFEPTCFLFAGRRWALYHNDATYLQLLGTTRGYRFAGSYSPTINVEADGTAHVALTSSPGEAPATITLVPPFVLGQGTVNLAEPIVVVPPAPDGVPDFPPFGRHVGVGLFKLTTGAGSFDGPGHFEILTDGASYADAKNKDRQFIADMKSAPTVPDGKLAALFVGVDDDRAVARRMSAARHVPIVWYTDGLPFRDAGLNPAPDDLLMLRAYPVDSLDLLAAELNRLTHPRLAIAWPLYLQTPETWSVADVDARQRPLFDLVQACARVLLVGIFSGAGRIGGTGTYPRFAVRAAKLVAASLGMPDLHSMPAPHPKPRPIPVPAQPTDSQGALFAMDTIHSYGVISRGVTADGKPLEAHYSRPDKSHIYSVQRDGSIEERTPDQAGNFETFKRQSANFITVNSKQDDGTPVAHSFALAPMDGLL